MARQDLTLEVRMAGTTAGINNPYGHAPALGPGLRPRAFVRDLVKCPLLRAKWIWSDEGRVNWACHLHGHDPAALCLLSRDLARLVGVVNGGLVELGPSVRRQLDGDQRDLVLARSHNAALSVLARLLSRSIRRQRRGVAARRCRLRARSGSSAWTGRRRRRRGRWEARARDYGDDRCSECDPNPLPTCPSHGREV